jgi:transcriptional regulator MraZ
MAHFQGHYTNRLDKKGRVSIPAPFRDILVSQGLKGMIASASLLYPAIEGFGNEYVEKRRSEIDRLDPGSIEFEDAEYTFFARIKELAFDSEGRVTLPESMISHARLAEQVGFIARGRTFEIWEPAAFEAAEQARKQRMGTAAAARRPSGARP